MYYLGQSIAYRDRLADPFCAAILLQQKDEKYKLVIWERFSNVNLDPKLVIKEVYPIDLHPIRIEDKESHTGHTIYKGKLYRKGIIKGVELNHTKMFGGSEEKLIEYLKEVQDKIDNK